MTEHDHRRGEQRVDRRPRLDGVAKGMPDVARQSNR
jgi:hypothetical protein